jgi:tetratricopeptide (TPR) repeat protein
MGFFPNFFKKKNKVYLTDIQDKLSNNIKIYINKYKKQFDEMDINYLYIIRMIYYIEENYDINDENIQENIQEYINKDCILLEILINLPKMPLKTGEYTSYIKMFYKNAKIDITSNMNENKGLLWQILKKNNKSNENINEVVSNLIKVYDILIKLDEIPTYTKEIIKIYIDLITMYIYGNMSYKENISNNIVTRLNNIYRGLLMKLANYMKIISTDQNTDDIQLNITSKQMEKLDLGKLYIGYPARNIDVFNDNVVNKIILDMEDYEQLDIMKLYTALHSNIKQIEKINLHI